MTHRTRDNSRRRYSGVWRAQVAAQDVRNAMDFEKMAALIIHGTIYRQTCKATPPIEAVFDGRFLELNVTLFNPIREEKYTNVGMRIVVREGSSKHVVVTVHPLDLPLTELMNLPEVPHDIW